MRACVRLDGGVCLEWFAVEQGLRQACALAPLLFKTFAAVVHVAHTRFKADKDNMSALFGAPEEENGGWGGREKQSPESQTWRRRFEVCFTLTMPETSRNRPRSRGRL